jgi:hypothetical protein
MKWQVNYAIKSIQESSRNASVQHIRDEAIQICIPSQPNVVAVISAANIISTEIAAQYRAEYPELDFLCGYRKECVWEGGAIDSLEGYAVGWGNIGTLISAIPTGSANSASHKNYFFAHRLIKQSRTVKCLVREFDRVVTVTIANGHAYRIGMIMEYEPTADVIRTFWERFGAIDIAWNINPNGNPTQKAIEAGQELGCKVLKWDELRVLLKGR